MVEGEGFEPSKLTRQIYSLIPLAAREPLLKRGDIIRHRDFYVKRLYEFNAFKFIITFLFTDSAFDFVIR